MLGEFHLLSETKSKSGLNISGHYTKLGAGMFTKYGLTFITHPSVILVLHLRNCTHRTKTRLMSRSLQHWWASAMSSTRCKAGVSMQCTMWSTRSPRMLGWHHSDVELMRTWLVQHSFAPINIPFLTCLGNMAFLSSSSIFAMSTRLLIRRRCRWDISLVSNAPIGTGFGPQNITVIMNQESHHWHVFLIGFAETHFPYSLETET